MDNSTTCYIMLQCLQYKASLLCYPRLRAPARDDPRAKSTSSALSWQMTGFLWPQVMSCHATPS